MPFQITGMVLACTKVRISRRTGNLGARQARSLEVGVDVININAERLRGRAKSLRAGQALVRPDGAKHDDVGTELQLRMPDKRPRLGNGEDLDEAEGRAERSNRAAGVVVSKDREDRLHIVSALI